MVCVAHSGIITTFMNKKSGYSVLSGLGEKVYIHAELIMIMGSDRPGYTPIMPLPFISYKSSKKQQVTT